MGQNAYINLTSIFEMVLIRVSSVLLLVDADGSWNRVGEGAPGTFSLLREAANRSEWCKAYISCCKCF